MRGFNPSKLNQLRKVAQNPADSEIVQALATILTELEHQQLEAVETLHDAHDIDGIDVQTTRAERQDALLTIANKVAAGEFETYWFETVVPIQNPQDAQALAGLDDAEWRTQLETWATRYRQKAPDEFADDSDRDIARQHVERTFDVSLGEFEREVINYSRQDALKTVLAGNFTAVTEGIHQAAEHARDHPEGSA